jgi:hypothetical protein
MPGSSESPSGGSLLIGLVIRPCPWLLPLHTCPQSDDGQEPTRWCAWIGSWLNCGCSLSLVRRATGRRSCVVGRSSDECASGGRPLDLLCPYKYIPGSPVWDSSHVRALAVSIFSFLLFSPLLGLWGNYISLNESCNLPNGQA